MSGGATEPARVRLPHRFEPRGYQLPLLAALDRGFKRLVQVWHRRAGKEKTALNATIKEMQRRVGAYFYVFPTFVQGRKVLWDGADKDGLRFLDHFPKELMDGKPNQTEMKWRMRNGSLFQIIGSDTFDATMGTNPRGMVFSEYSLQDPLCWGYFRPILAENGGWALFNFTPRGENHAYDLWELAKADPERWFADLLTVDDTGAIPKDVLEQELREIMRLYGSDALYLQEYFCSFSAPVSGAFYAAQVGQAMRDGRVGHVPHEPTLTVDTWWDLGMNDRMSIWFVQHVGAETRVIDYMEGTGQGLPFYAQRLREKPYAYDRHIGPHDLKVRELGNGKTRLDTAAQLGITFEVAPNIPRMDGIEAARSLFARCRFDKERTKDGLNALKNYRKQYDEKRKTYLAAPYHDWASNGADAFRYGAVTIDLARQSPSAEGRAGAAGKDRYKRGEERRGGGDAQRGLRILG